MLDRSRARPPRTRVLLGALAALALSAGCGDFAFGLHEHNNYCGHGYLEELQPNPTPADIAGADAWRGQLYENQIRWKDPFRGGRPVPERPMPWWVPGSGNKADRTPAQLGEDPEFGPGYEKRGAPNWPLPEPSGERE
jgi:hypothetical protein